MVGHSRAYTDYTPVMKELLHEVKLRLLPCVMASVKIRKTMDGGECDFHIFTGYLIFVPSSENRDASRRTLFCKLIDLASKAPLGASLL